MMTTHELAKMLLAMDDVPVFHHYWHMDDFDDFGLDYISKIRITEHGGKLYLTEGKSVNDDYESR